MTAVRAAAHAWNAAGVCVVPARSDGTKAPAVDWRVYTSRLPNETELRNWFDRGRDGYGLVLGAVSGQAEMLEFEGRAAEGGIFQAFVAAAMERGLADPLGRLWNGYRERTPSGGIHLVFRVADGPALGNTKLARRPSTDAELAANPKAKVQVLIETRGEGGFSVTAPSGGTTHETGRGWTLEAGTPGVLPVLTAAERDALYAVAASLDTMPARPDTGPAGERRAGPLPEDLEGLSPMERFEATTSWAEILEPHGWTYVSTDRDGRTVYWLRPGKERGGASGWDHSASTGRELDRDRMYVWSTSTELDVETPMTKGYVHALLNFGGDMRAAFAGTYDDAALECVRPTLATRAADAPTRSSWAMRDPDEADGPTAPPPAFLARTDGRSLFYAGEVNSVIGESESGKSWIAQHGAAQALLAGQRVLYVDFESRYGLVVERLLTLGVPRDVLRELFRYVCPDEPLSVVAQADLKAAVAWGAALTVVDGVNAAMTVLGKDSNGTNDATAFVQAVLRPLAADGSAVVAIDHVRKHNEGQGMFAPGAIGSQAKRAMVSGATLSARVVTPFGRGKDGLVALVVDKDRPGHVRALSDDKGVVGLFVVEHDVTGRVGFRVSAPRVAAASEGAAEFATSDEEATIMRSILAYLGESDVPQSTAAIVKHVPYREAKVTAALAKLVEAGRVVRMDGTRGGKLHRLSGPSDSVALATT